MWIFIVAPFCLQALAIAFDEGYFHYRRGLPKWERIGHPLDTLSLLICFGIILFSSFNTTTLSAYCIFSVISCLMVTKDEFVHKHHCPWAENWLHACLFILHPIVLTFAGLIWAKTEGAPMPEWLSSWLDNLPLLENFLLFQTIFIFVFFLYQVIFWNIIWKNTPVIKQ